ncbi:unnamed protein product [Paramecium octaurelia]|uniref:Uncharacterized protein n=1 Tax=Paramecium octaurelia TaxID=43137 RepID=A0A8S1SGV4_PAROT|nr:unnamed protein product [Paramecium octaurelia]
MIRFQCLRCNHIQDDDSSCQNCDQWDKQKKQIEDFKRVNRKIEENLSTEIVCCGVGELQRRKIIIGLFCVLMSIGFILLIGDFSDESSEIGMTLIGFGILVGVIGCIIIKCCG